MHRTWYNIHIDNSRQGQIELTLNLACHVCSTGSHIFGEGNVIRNVPQYWMHDASVFVYILNNPLWLPTWHLCRKWNTLFLYRKIYYQLLQLSMWTLYSGDNFIVSFCCFVCMVMVRFIISSTL